MSDTTIGQYRKKRDFARTPEPPPGEERLGRGPLTFVIQKHNASHLHYDFRLEVDGVLKSWSVPKGPSLDPQVKRLAVMVEDHPLDYATFEGAIPRGQYGAGQVIVWDRGTYSPDEGGALSFQDRSEADERMKQGLAEGKLSIFLLGQKLKGSWALVKMKRGDRNWLLIKHKDRFVEPERNVLQEERSVLSGLTIEDLSEGRPPRPSPETDLALRPGDLPGARPAPMPASVAPMLASLAEGPFSSPRWLFEPKLDGVRAIAIVKDGRVKLISRTGQDYTRLYPVLVEDLKRQPAGDIALDGEIVALDASGKPSFEILQQRMSLSREPEIRLAEEQAPVFYYVFDILYLIGYDLRAVTLENRKNLLRQVLAPSDRVRMVEYFEGDGEITYEAAIDQGLEGVIAKRLDSTYEFGARSRQWLKVKAVLSDEFIIGGFTRGQGEREDTLGALLIGQLDEKGSLVYVSHVGSGFSDRDLVGLRCRLESMEIPDCPFARKPRLKGPATWVRPELVAEIKFASWTMEGSLRAPVFLRLRRDKPPEEVMRAQVAPASEHKSASTGIPAGTAGEHIESILGQLAVDRDRFTLEVDGQRLSLSNLDKVLWPALEGRRALTKRDLLTYLARVSPYLLPHLRDRPLTLTRYPEGIAGEHFFQKHWDGPPPGFVETVRVFSEHNGGDQDYLVCNNLPTLLWLGQVGDLELHSWFSRTAPSPDGRQFSRLFAGSLENISSSLLNYPDFIVFDIDPYIYSGREPEGAEPELNRRAFDATRQVALWLKELLEPLSLASFVKTSGRTGLHIYVPILRRLDYETVHSIARTIGDQLLRQHPRVITMDWRVGQRNGKVFLDYNQNLRGKTLASIYSPRATPEATVSMPVRWEEIEGVYPTDFTILRAPERLALLGDLWAGIMEAKRDLDRLLDSPAPPQASQG